ncbi:DUF4350 domain-containing protein [Dyadobacter sp. CY261]|uniref:DUF4350 domain-containing protein n=1 Tax=Dyadobacter sp. CY261 TaxID=2907203 RepID=UPI001F37E084|nr:DUF4350 domain-containing protein [Dyadobacter sp. CY261]MCF0074903.1 DUF4350 domain-containing protein [Dyadobacter sp. CY261]
MTRLLPNTILLLLLCVGPVLAQQVPDYDFDPQITDPLYPSQKGPTVVIDQAHHNFHRIDGRYNAFAKVLSRDGFDVKPGTEPFSKQSLAGVKILVIANALHASNETQWSKPTPSAFTPEEILAVAEWVREGGSLFLISDHMPMPGANETLAAAFGFKFYNGFASDTTAGLYPGAKRELDVFKKSNKTLAVHETTTGKKQNETIEEVATFTGQGFEVPKEAVSLLTFDDKYKILLPDTAWKFHQNTPRIAIKGFSQGAVRKFHKGRVAVFGEAAMFSSQLKGPEKIPFGLRSQGAENNLRFLRNLIRWLDDAGN